MNIKRLFKTIRKPSLAVYQVVAVPKFNRRKGNRAYLEVCRELAFTREQALAQARQTLSIEGYIVHTAKARFIQTAGGCGE